MRAETVFSEVVGVKRLAEGAVVRSFVVAFPSVRSFLRSFVVASLFLRCSFVVPSFVVPSFVVPSFVVPSLFLRCSFLPSFVRLFVRRSLIIMEARCQLLRTYSCLLLTYLLTTVVG